MKLTFETRKLYFGFPVFFLGYKDEVHGYNISTSSSAYTLGSMMVVAMRTKGNAVTEIKKHGSFTVNIPTEELLTEVEIAGFNSRKDKFALTGLDYTIGETVDAPMVTACPVSIECQVVEFVECGALTNIIARVTRREVEEDLKMVPSRAILSHRSAISEMALVVIIETIKMVVFRWEASSRKSEKMKNSRKRLGDP